MPGRSRAYTTFLSRISYIIQDIFKQRADKSSRASVTVKQRKQRAYPFVSSFTLRSRCEELSICVPTILEMCVLFLGGKNQFYRLALPYVPAMLLSAH